MNFTHDSVEYYVDDEIPMKQVVGDPDHLYLTDDFHCMGNNIPKGFKWDGASSPNIPIARWIAPKYHKNIVASCLHDFECRIAKNDSDRKKADFKYWLLKKYVEKDTSWKNRFSWRGVRIGAFFGIGSNF